MKNIILILFLLISTGLMAQIPNPVVYYNLDDGVTGVALDTVNNNDAAVTGATQNVAGKIGQAVSFDGDADYITIPEIAGLQFAYDNFAMSAWIKVSAYPEATAAIIGAEQYGAYLAIGSTGLLTAGAYYQNSLVSSFTVPLDTWTFVGFSYDYSQLYATFYMNDAYSQASFTADIGEDDASIYIGSTNISNWYFNGVIDEVALWKPILPSAADMQTIYEESLTYPWSSPLTPTGVGKNVSMPAGNKKAVILSDIKRNYNVYRETPTNLSFTIYNEWNFDDESLGDYSTEISNDFDVISLYWEENTDIVYDTIDGVRTKALKVTQAAGVMDQGLQLDAALGADYDEVYMTYNIKFTSNWAWLEGKLPGLSGRPFPTINYPAEPDDGFISILLFKEAGRVTTFNYDHSYECSWGACATESYNTGKSVYFMSNVWYEVTQRMVKNTFTGSTPNTDGLNEVWINGVKVYEEHSTSTPTASCCKTYFEQDIGGIDALTLAMFYSNSGSEPDAQTYSIIDNIKIYTPNNDPTLGTTLPHNDAEILDTPSDIIDQTIVYDSLRNTAGTLRNSEYGSNYSNEIEEVYLIDAGAGNTVTYTFNAGNLTGDDFVILRDGNQSTSDVLYRISDANPSGAYTSTGRYMSIQFATQGSGTSTGFTGTITFN